MKMNLSRRNFITGAALTATIGVSAKNLETPKLVIAAMSDNHLHPDRPKTHQRTEAAFRLFREANADIIVDTGDIADLSHPTELKFFRDTFDKCFAGTDTVPFFCIANHDYNLLPNTKRNDPTIIENAWRTLKMSGPNPATAIKGYQFVNVYQNEPDRHALEKAIAKAVSASAPDKPVFVIQHVPPMFTTTGTEHWSSQSVRDVLNKFPQVIALTGHIHTAMSWAANIWQGEFTAINLGAHAEYSNQIDGEAMILNVYDNRIDIRRYEAVSGREIGADDRWSIPLPLDPQHGPYRPEIRKRQCPVPMMSAESTATYRFNRAGERGHLIFNSASPRGTAYHYRITLESQGDKPDKWNFLGTLDWSTPQVMDEPKTWECPIFPGMLDCGKRHRATIVPMNSHEVIGSGRTMEFDVGLSSMSFLSEKSLRLTRYQHSDIAGEATFTPDADGWFEHKRGVTLAVLSPDFAAAIKDKKAIQLIMDISTDQPGTPNTFTIAKFSPKGGKMILGTGGGRIYTLPGKFTSHRYVWVIKNTATSDINDEYALLIREGNAGRFRINSISCLTR